MKKSQKEHHDSMQRREQKHHRQILEGADLAFLQRTRGELQALLDTSQRWTELMRSLIGSIPRENRKFGQDVLGRDFLKGIPTEGVYAILADTGPEERLGTLLQEIDRKIAALTHGQFSAGEAPAPLQKPAA